MTRPLLSIVVIEFNMAREIPRTIFSLGPKYQRNVAANDYEIILVDNGSTEPSDKETLRAAAANATFHSIADPSPSPARAINWGLAMARGDLIGVLIDGARMATPGLLSTALEASRAYPRGTIGPLGFHLGHQAQTIAAQHGYNQQAEDVLLASVDWKNDGYRLFDIAVIAPGQRGGWFGALLESTALFMARGLWNELGGYDERFVAPGGGLVNLDTYIRACQLPSAQPIMLLGEATFHQFHNGISSNAVPENNPWDQFHTEYVRIRGKALQIWQHCPLCFGRVTEHARRSILASAAG